MSFKSLLPAAMPLRPCEQTGPRPEWHAAPMIALQDRLLHSLSHSADEWPCCPAGHSCPGKAGLRCGVAGPHKAGCPGGRTSSASPCQCGTPVRSHGSRAWREHRQPAITAACQQQGCGLIPGLQAVVSSRPEPQGHAVICEKPARAGAAGPEAAQDDREHPACLACWPALWVHMMCGPGRITACSLDAATHMCCIRTSCKMV